MTKTYTPEQVVRIVHLRQLRIDLLKGGGKMSNKNTRLKNVQDELWTLTQNPAFKR
jgi:hypothetical protein